MDVKTLSSMLGHVSAATTLNIYTHIADDMRQSAADTTASPAPTASARSTTTCLRGATRWCGRMVRSMPRYVYAKTRTACEEKLKVLIVQMKKEIAKAKTTEGKTKAARQGLHLDAL